MEEGVVPTTKTRVSKVATVIVPIADQDAAIDFYVDKLGFEKRVDVPFGGGYRWVEVGIADEATTVALAPPPPDKPESAGNRETGISMQTDAITAYIAELKTSGGADEGERSTMDC